MRRRRSVTLASLAAAVLGMSLLQAPSASAAVSSIAISPTSQTRATGQTAIWGWSWGGTGTYSPKFFYGDGGSRTYGSQSNGGSGSASCIFNTCQQRTYTQSIQVNTSSATGQTTVTTPGGCR